MESPDQDEPAGAVLNSHPDAVRAYIADMAMQMASLAVAQGDFSLASALHLAATRARTAAIR